MRVFYLLFAPFEKKKALTSAAVRNAPGIPQVMPGA